MQHSNPLPIGSVDRQWLRKLWRNGQCIALHRLLVRDLNLRSLLSGQIDSKTLGRDTPLGRQRTRPRFFAGGFFYAQSHA